jgi:hypothetical protein
MAEAYPLAWPEGWPRTKPNGALEMRFRSLAKTRHPDNGGSDTLMAELNVAFKEAKEELNGAS